MSRRLQDLFWTVDLPGTEQLVAQRLAWHANDEDGRCWPGIASLSKATGLSARAIQNAIKALDVADHLSRDERVGLGVVYTIHPRTRCAGENGAPDADAQGGNPKTTTPARGAPPTVAGNDDGAPAADAPRTTCTPAPDARTPARRAPKQVKNREDTNGGSARDARSPEERITGQVGRRIEPEWQPIADLPEAIAKVVAGWPPGRLDEILAEFRDYWLAAAGREASKRDWDRTWWNRLRGVIRRDEERKERRNAARGGSDRRGGRGGFRDPLLEREFETRGGHAGVD